MWTQLTEDKTFVELYKIECGCRCMKWHDSMYCIIFSVFSMLLLTCRTELIEGKSNKCGYADRATCCSTSVF